MKELHDGTEVEDSVPTKNVSGMRYLLTEQEIAERQAEEATARTGQVAAHLSAYRKSRETGGFEIMGITIPTDEKTERRIIGARVKAQADPDYVIQDWTTDGGATSTTLTAQMIIAISDAFDEHVQKCFSADVSVKPNLSNYKTTAEVEAAFEAAYEGA